MNIWLVDATTYPTKITEELRDLKQDYYKIKNVVKTKKYGIHIHPKEKTFPMGLLRIASILAANGVDTSFFHLADFIDVIDTIKNPDADIVAFSAVCPTVGICEQLAIRLRLHNSQKKYILGGSQVNVAIELTRKKYPGFDMYIEGSDVTAVAQILDKTAKEILLPKEYVDYSLLPYPLIEYAINTFSTLGCKHSCSFCQDCLVPYYNKPLQGEFEAFKLLLPPKTPIHFFDSILGYNNKGLRNVCSELKRIHHDFSLSCELRDEDVSAETIYRLEDAGFVEVRIGVQQASDRVNALNNRQQLNRNIIDRLRLIKSVSKMYISIYILSGLPGSTAETNNYTHEMIQECLHDGYVDEVKNCIFVPYPRDNMIYNDVIIENDNWEAYDRQSYPTYHLSMLSSHEIWRDFIFTTRLIVSTWAKANKIDDIKELQIDGYPEYTQMVYSVRD